MDWFNRLFRYSLKFRVVLFTMIFMSIGLIITALLLVNIFNQYIERQVKQELTIHLNQLTAALIIDTDNQITTDKSLSDPRFDTPYSGLYWQISSLQGEPLLRSRSLWEDILLVTAPTNYAERYHVIESPPDGRMIVLTRLIELEETHVDHKQLLLSIAINESLILDASRAFKQILLFSFIGLAIGMLVIALIQIYLSLKPLNQIKHQLSEITQGNSRHLEGAYPIEIQPLIQSFNEVLNHDTEVLTRARTQAGNLAHSLKTPLSILAQASANYTYCEDTNSNENTSDLPKIIDTQVKLIKQHIDYHLAQTRAAASVRIPGQKTDVSEVVQKLVKTLMILYKDKSLTFDINVDNVYFKGEQQDLYEILGNLIDNASKWASKMIMITAVAQADFLEIMIEDDGCGLETTARERVLQRGIRIDEEISGSGIGLFIVNDLCQLYGGRLILAESKLGGLSVKLQLPLFHQP